MCDVGNSFSRGKNIITSPGCSGNSIVCFDWCVGMCSGVMMIKLEIKNLRTFLLRLFF